MIPVKQLPNTSTKAPKVPYPLVGTRNKIGRNVYEVHVRQ